MSPIHRPRIPGLAKIDVRLLEEIENTFLLDEARPPGVIAALYERKYAWHHTPLHVVPDDPSLEDDIYEALNGCFADLDEAHCIQRLRGWHRTRRGRITVDARWLAAARNALDGLTLSLGDECDDALRELNYAQAHPIHAEVIKSLIRNGTCGECSWCVALRLRDECDAELDAAGFDGGVYYRAYCLGESQEQLAEHYGWPTTAGAA